MAAARQVSMPAPKLEPDAISVAQDTFIGAALVGPSVSVALTLAALAAAAAYAGPAVLALTAIPMIVIANTYRRLNLWNANCGASFEWVGRAPPGPSRQLPPELLPLQHPRRRRPRRGRSSRREQRLRDAVDQHPVRGLAPDGP
jgi:hypothetical protein